MPWRDRERCTGTCSPTSPCAALPAPACSQVNTRLAMEFGAIPEEASDYRRMPRPLQPSVEMRATRPITSGNGILPMARVDLSPAQRGGFLNLWQASNELEITAHPYEGDLYDGDGRPIHFENQYRADFLTELAKRFLQNVSKQSPFLLVVSYLEPHQQNDLGRMVAPKGYAERYQNPFVPEDLKHFPGNWQQQLPDYYGSIKRIDECVGEIRTALANAGLDQNTIMVFVSDHGCHFMTRNTEYKRSGHDA